MKTHTKKRRIAFSGTSRAAMILGRALKHSGTSHCADLMRGGDLISKGQAMGIEIVDTTTFLEKVEAYFDSKVTSTGPMLAKRPKIIEKVIQLRPPFIKVEDQSRQFRPLVRQFSKWPTIEDFVVKADKDPLLTRKKHPRKRYCENCSVYFDSLCKHLETDLHKAVIGQQGYYEEVDALIKNMPSLKELVDKVRGKKNTANC